MAKGLYKNKIYFLIFFSFVLFFLILLTSTKAHAAIIEPVYKVLNEQDQIKSVWNQVLIFVNSLGAAVLIFIAFANILRININNYGIKKFLPTLVLTIIAANFSYLICRLLVDLANVVCDLLITGPGGANVPKDMTQSYAAFDFTKEQVKEFSDYPRILFIALLEFVGAIFILILAFLFFIRNYFIYFLVVLAPIAFVSLSLPQTKTAFNQWWSNFWKWTFLPIVSLFWLWLAAQWIGSSFLPGSTTLMGYAFAGVCYYLAITTPFKMGGGIMQQWGNLGKKVWGATGGAAWKSTGGAAINATKGGIKMRYDRTKLNIGSRLYDTDAGRYIARQQSRQRFLNQQAQDIRAKFVENQDKYTYTRAYADHISGRRPLNDASLSRVRARMRNWIIDEQKSVKDGDPVQLRDRLQGLGFLDPAGRLRNNNEIGQLVNADDQIVGRAIVKELREQTKRSGTRVQARPVWEGLFGTPGALTPAEQQQMRRASTNDIAHNLFAASAEGEEVAQEAAEQQQVRAELAQQVGGQENADQIANLALHNGAAEVGSNGQITINAQNLNLTLGPEAQTLFNQLRERRNGFLGEQTALNDEQIENVLTGINHAASSLRGGRNLAQLNAQIGTGLNLANQDSAESLERARRITSQLVPAASASLGMGDAAAQRELIRNTLQQMQSGLQHIGEEGAASIARMTEEEFGNYQSQLRSSLENQAGRNADIATSARQIISERPVGSIVPDDTSVADALSDQSEYLHQITEHLNTIASDTAQAKGLGTLSAPTFTAQEARTTIMGLMSGGGADPFAEVMNSRDTEKRLAQAIGDRVGQAVSRANTRAPQSKVDSVQPQVPNVTNNVTNVTQTGTREAPSPSPERGNDFKPPENK